MRIKLIGTEKEIANGLYVILNNFDMNTIKENHFTLFVPEYDEERVRKFLKEKGVKYQEDK